MAGITSVPFKLKLFHHHNSTASPLFSSYKLFGLSLSNPCSLRLNSYLSLSLPSDVTVRYGGGSRPSSYGGDSRRPQKGPDDDQALDLSTLRSDTVRLIDENQNMVGVVSTGQALQMADDAELDLVIVSPDADPPVVRLMDYSKYRYEQQKKKRGQQKKSAANRMDLKELKMGYNIDQHDYSVRLKAAQKFLKDGDKVKIIVNLKGRENEFRNIAIELIRRFQNDVGKLGKEEAKNFRDKNIFIILVPNQAAVQKTQETPKKRDKSAENEVSISVEA